MSKNGPAAWYHSNRYNVEAQCAPCKGIVRHEPWCISMDAAVAYAYAIVEDPNKLSEGDALILHSLGVKWVENPCPERCQPAE